MEYRIIHLKLLQKKDVYKRQHTHSLSLSLSIEYEQGNSAAKMLHQISKVSEECRLQILPNLFKNAELFNRVTTGDETWCFQYDLERNCFFITRR